MGFRLNTDARARSGWICRGKQEDVSEVGEDTLRVPMNRVITVIPNEGVVVAGSVGVVTNGLRAII